MTENGKTVSLSIIIPAKNEAAVIGDVVSSVRGIYADAEILVVDDGSTDETATFAERAGATVVNHPVSLGNGAAIKAGARKVPASDAWRRTVFTTYSHR
jgi:glycosyltransferase involved in cell wall biosynthesis